LVQAINPPDNKIKLDSTASNKGGSIDWQGIALKTIPFIIRGWADRSDPHYMLVSRLTDAGALPTGKTWKSFPIFWPINMMPFFAGWGPPLTGIGALAYSMPQLPGDKKAMRLAQANQDPSDGAGGAGGADDDCA
jgi:hypothetical protein